MDYNWIMEVQIAVAKIRKYATPDSGDTVEVVERPNGGLSVVLADGQSSGRGAKNISMMVVRRVIASFPRVCGMEPRPGPPRMRSTPNAKAKFPRP